MRPARGGISDQVNSAAHRPLLGRYRDQARRHNAQEMRDAAVEANHSKSWMVGVDPDPDSDDASAWLAGADLEIDSYSKLANLLTKKKGA